jgi:short-subunit dehydrogenase
VTISGKNVLITGASAGIGAALAAQLAARGARLCLASRSPSAAAGAIHLTVDLADAAARQRLVADAEQAIGPLDMLIHNAGIGLYARSWEADPADVQRMFEVNLFAAVDLARAALPGMIARGSGLIVNISSIAGQVPLPWFTLYSASKAALNSFTDGLRMELHQTGVHTLLVCPSYVKTKFQDHVLGGRPPRKIRESKRAAITPEQCAADIVRGIERNARTVVTPGHMWAFVGAARAAPRLVHGRLARYNREL